MTCTLVGAQPRLELYTTKNVNEVDELPEPGLTDPELSEIWCLAELQGAPRTGAAPVNTAAASAESIRNVSL